MKPKALFPEKDGSKADIGHGDFRNTDGVAANLAETEQKTSSELPVPVWNQKSMNITDQKDMPPRKTASKRRRLEASMHPDLGVVRDEVVDLTHLIVSIKKQMNED